MKLPMALLCLLAPMSVQAQNVTCTAKVPHEICEKAKLEFGYWEDGLDQKVPVVIADPYSFQKEEGGFFSSFPKSGSPRSAVAKAYGEYILAERTPKGNPCPVKVVVSTDQFVPAVDLGFKLIAGMNPDEVFRIAVYVGGFLAGCESSLDY